MKLQLNSLALYPAPIRLVIFLLILLLVWLPVAAPIYLFLRGDPNLVTILTMGLLFIAFFLVLRFWSKRVYQQSQLIQYYGLEFTRKNGIALLNGLSIGLLFILGLFTLEWGLGWLEIKPPSVFLLRLMAEGLLSAVGIGLAEELLFRGWLLDELERDYSPPISLWVNGIIFAILHFIKPLEEVIRTLPQFPALVILGLTLVWAKRSRRGLLGLPIGLHAGLVWGYYIFNVGKLIDYAEGVPAWITGVNGNPLAGIMGLIFLAILALGVRFVDWKVTN